MASPFGVGGAFGGGGGGSNPFGAGASPSNSRVDGSSSSSPWAASGTTSVFGSNGASTSPFGASSNPFGSSTPSTSFGFGLTPSAFAPASFVATSQPAAAAAAAPTPPAAAATPPSTRNPNQISTLEVLGEDSGARKQRFESSLANNRYLELKPLREAQRLRDIKNGLIPDPLKPMRLDQATDFLGTCEDMCPEWEREEREYQNNVDALERYPGTTRIDPSRAVKAFHRPAAGNEQPLPSDVRPPRVLKTTLDYLFHELLPTAPLHVTHPFLRDRTRSVRQDLTMQNIRGEAAIECNERIARYHVLALGTLREQASFSESQELEQLRKVLKSLNEFYDDARLADPPIAAPNEAEFRSYNVLTHLRDPDIIWSCELLPPHVFDDPKLQLALRLHSLVQRSNIPRGERASLNAASRFFKLLARTEVPYLFGCILSTHFNDIRKNALESMKNAYMQQHSLFPARTLVKVLGCDDEAEVESICRQLGIGTKKGVDGKMVVELHKAVVMKNATLKTTVSKRLVEAKQGTTSYQEVIDGANYPSAPVESIPFTPSLAASTFLSPAAQPKPPAALPTPTPAAANPSTSTAFSQPSASAPSSLSAFSSSFTPQPSIFGGAMSAIPTPVPTPPPPSAPPALNPVAPAFAPAFASNSTTRAQATSAPSNPFAAAAPSSFPSRSIFEAPAKQAPVQEKKEPTIVIPKAVPAPRSSLPPIQDKPIKPIPTKTSHLPPLAAPTKPIAVIATAPPKPDRSPLLASLSKKFASDLFASAAQTGTRHAVEMALQEYWDSIARQEQDFMSRVSRCLCDELVSDHIRLTVMKEVIRVKRERKVMRRTWEQWRLTTSASLEAKERERRRRKRFEENVKQIDVGLKREVEGDEEEMEEILDLSSLSLGVGEGDQAFVNSDQRDKSFAKRIKKAEIEREQLWRPGTLLDILAQQVNAAVSIDSNRRQSLAALVSTSSTSSAFARWLSCKFDLSDTDQRAIIDTPNSDITVEMVADADDPTDELLEDIGLILFDCTEEILSSSMYDARQRLHRLVEAVHEVSRFVPSLIVTCCPSTQLSWEEAAALKARLTTELNMIALRDSLGPVEFWFARLAEAEEQFSQVTSSTLHELRMRPDRATRPLVDFIAPLARVWADSFRLTFSRPIVSDPTASCNAFLSSLTTIIDAAKSTASVRPPSIGSLPPIATSPGSFRDRLMSYLSNSRVKVARPFPLLESALTERPPVSEGTLARLLLEHLVSYLLARVEDFSIQQQVYEFELPRFLARLEQQLLAISILEEDAAPIKENVAPSSVAPKGKRKASSSPEVSMGKNKKIVLVPSPPTADRLGALEKIILEAKGLLSLSGINGV